MMNKLPKYYWLLILVLLGICSSFQQKKIFNQNISASVKIIFINNVKGNKIVLNDSLYANPFGEKYNITKLRYYVSNIELKKANNFFKEKNSYHLIDESEPGSKVINLSLPEGNYNQLQFLLGVDSLHNVSGAQTDDLDPAKDMFWTWNSGYVMAKMEGNSPASNQVNNKFEYHIGGFSGPNNVIKEIHLNFPGNTFHFAANKRYEIIINADIDAWWQNPHDIKISEHANITSPGENAKNISDNYANMFHIEKVIVE
ncbi:MAG TPA: MbnP family protein [Ginsengibacter sp.]